MPDDQFIAADAPVLPYGRQLVEEDDIAAVAEVLRGDFLTMGPTVTRFEAALAARLDAAHAVACANGTAALHLAALACDIGCGDAVVVPTLTFLATANAVRATGAEVVFADVDPSTGLMRPTDLDAAIGRAGDRRIRAVFPVHLNGQTCAMDQIAALAGARNLAVVEDACHALGGDRHDGAGGTTPVGACRHCDATVFSFHPVKTIAAGEGGALTTNDPALAERAARLRNHGMVRDGAFAHADLARSADGGTNPWYYEMPTPGFNYRASDIHCALALSQLGKLNRFVARRRALADRYDALLAPLAPLVRPIDRIAACTPAWHLYPVLIDFTAAAVDRATLMRRLRRRGIGTQVHYLPVHLQPYYRQRYGDLSLPGAWAYYQSCLSLPMFAAMADADAERVAAELADCLGAER